MQDGKNFLIAAILSTLILIGWTWFYEKPRLEQQSSSASEQLASNPEIIKPIAQANSPSLGSTDQSSSLTLKKDRAQVLDSAANNRVQITSPTLHGSILLEGLRFDDLTLANYYQSLNHIEEVVLLSPAASKERYFADFGFISGDKNIELPSPKSIWIASGHQLTPETPITFSWKNSQKIEFKTTVSLDKEYLFSISQAVINRSGRAISLASYGRISRNLAAIPKSNFILHEGPIGVFDGTLKDLSYSKLAEERKSDFTNSKPGGWLGITDKYWLTALIPDQTISYHATFNSDSANQNNLVNTDFISEQREVAAGQELKLEHHFFAGAKKVNVLDRYSKEYGIKLFDRAIDFGWFYFLTKPLFFALQFLSKLFGNFGLAILGMTVIVKALLYPMANHSYAAVAKMKNLQPKIEKIRAKYKDDKIALNRETMDLYKKEKVNPAAGCLPILIQIPVFFSLYKVLFVTIDMRLQPFYGWIKDLSAPDPTSIFNLFGLLPFEVSSTFAIGVWPILMGITMYLQQRLSPTPADPIQARVMKCLPVILTFVLAKFPAGLVIYWTWSNVLSILQQMVINKRLQGKYT